MRFGSIARKLQVSGGMMAFVTGYAAIWTLFSLVAAALQMATSNLVPLTGMMALTSHAIGGTLLLAAGLYQFSPLKSACLKHCQSPFFFLARHWRNGQSGAFRMGLSHGLYCMGCCWMLMLLLFYVGVMELNWIVGLAAYVAAEKLIPAQYRFDRAAGIVLIAWGIWVLSRALG